VPVFSAVTIFSKELLQFDYKSLQFLSIICSVVNVLANPPDFRIGTTIQVSHCSLRWLEGDRNGNLLRGAITVTVRTAFWKLKMQIRTIGKTAEEDNPFLPLEYF
jgi:hypothetical protein